MIQYALMFIINTIGGVTGFITAWWLGHVLLTMMSNRRVGFASYKTFKRILEHEISVSEFYNHCAEKGDLSDKDNNVNIQGMGIPIIITIQFRYKGMILRSPVSYVLAVIYYWKIYNSEKKNVDWEEEYLKIL